MSHQAALANGIHQGWIIAGGRPGFATVFAQGNLAAFASALITSIEHHRAVSEFDKLDFVGLARSAFRSGFPITPGIAIIVTEGCINLPASVGTLVERHENAAGVRTFG